MTSLKLGPMSSKVLDQLEQAGHHIDTNFDAPRPEVPDDLTDLNDEDVISLYNSFVEYDNFLSIQATIAGIDAADRNKQLQIYEARFISDAPKGETLAKTKAKFLEDNTWVSLSDEADTASAYTELIKTLQKNTNEKAWVVKAELQRRKSQSFRPYTP